MDDLESVRSDQDHLRTDLSIDESTTWLDFIEECDRVLSEAERTDLKRRPALSPAIFDAAGRLRTRTARVLARLLITRVAEVLATSPETAAKIGATRPSAKVAHGAAALPGAEVLLQPEAADALDPRVKAVLHYVEDEHGHSACRLDEAARNLRLSRSYLSRLILKDTGITFNRHLQLARMNTAARLLQETDLTIKEVSSGTGYEHVPSFDRQFRSHFRLTPSDFRRVVRLL